MRDTMETKMNQKLSLLREEILRISGVNPKKCMRCGKCTGTCPAYHEMEYHPHEVVDFVDRGEIVPLLDAPSLDRCLSCMACTERCPRGVEPSKLVEAVCTVRQRLRGGYTFSPDDIPARLDEDMPQQLLVSAMRKYRK